jgi:aerobic-type carbon monoxide dehydrogenase small subunit (CoxS/CutS family)
MKETIQFKLNGKDVELSVDPSRQLLWVLRTDLGLTGSKYGCGQGLCGACTVLVDKKAIRSCRRSIRSVAGKEVLTVEGLAQDGKLNPVQRAFIEHDALQCGFCIPGMVVNAYGILLNNPRSSAEQVLRQMEGNLCRCAAHKRIVQAVETAAKEMRGA